MTTCCTTASEPYRQRTGAHLAGRGELTEKLASAPFQVGNLCIQRHRDLLTDSLRHCRLSAEHARPYTPDGTSSLSCRAPLAALAGVHDMKVRVLPYGGY